MRRGLMAAVLFATFALTGCGTDSAGKSADQQLQVTATTSQIADAAENIGGKHVKVTSLMGPGLIRTFTKLPKVTRKINVCRCCSVQRVAFGRENGGCPQKNR